MGIRRKGVQSYMLEDFPKNISIKKRAMSDLLLESFDKLRTRAEVTQKEGKEAEMSQQRDSHNSAAARKMVLRPEGLGVARTKELLATLDPSKVEWIRHLGDRIIGSNAGHQFVLR